MKKSSTFIGIAAILILSLTACNKGYSWGTYGYQQKGGGGTVRRDTVELDYPERKDIVKAADLVLLYGGSTHRSPYRWSVNETRDYVTYTDRDGKTHWLFDGFLCLEFKMEQFKNTLITGYTDANGNYMSSANKEVWQDLIDYYMGEGSGVDAIEAAVAEAATKIGEPPYKRRVVIGIPEPIRREDSHNDAGRFNYWGSIDGKEMIFSNTQDRFTAVKWYIDEVRKAFLAKNYKYVELAGFYWVAETSSNTSDILKMIAEYLNPMHYSFNWIPYFNAKGYDKWKDYGFNFSYLQPNYFFSDTVPYERLETACKNAKMYGYPGMEVEFDDNCVYSKWAKGKSMQKLVDYMEVFKAQGIWEKYYIAYYQGSWTVRSLKHSTDFRDIQAYQNFCDWVAKRPFRDNMK